MQWFHPSGLLAPAGATITSHLLTRPDFVQFWGCTRFCQGDRDRTMLQCLVRRRRIRLGRDASGQSCMDGYRYSTMLGVDDPHSHAMALDR